MFNLYCITVFSFLQNCCYLQHILPAFLLLFFVHLRFCIFAVVSHKYDVKCFSLHHTVESNGCKRTYMNNSRSSEQKCRYIWWNSLVVQNTKILILQNKTRNCSLAASFIRVVIIVSSLFYRYFAAIIMLDHKSCSIWTTSDIHLIQYQILRIKLIVQHYLSEQFS